MEGKEKEKDKVLIRPRQKVVIALGGNALERPGYPATFEEQRKTARRSAEMLLPVLQQEVQLAIVHGNGPQVGRILLQSERARLETPEVPLHAAGAESQGFVGYLLQQVMEEALREAGLSRSIGTILTQTRVSPEDPAWKHPVKPIGPILSPEEAERTRAEGFHVKRTERGYRRVVPSPEPLEFLEIEAIRRLLTAGCIVICAGGGGIPVLWQDGQLRGVDAVIDKDLAASLLAVQLQADWLIILTDVPGVAMNFGTKEQYYLRELSTRQAEKMLAQSLFPEGSMAPKIRAALRFVTSGHGRRAVIGSLEETAAVLRGESGTQMVTEA